MNALDLCEVMRMNRWTKNGIRACISFAKLCQALSVGL